MKKLIKPQREGSLPAPAYAHLGIHTATDDSPETLLAVSLAIAARPRSRTDPRLPGARDGAAGSLRGCRSLRPGMDLDA